MTRNYSPNHPAVKSWQGEPRQTVRQRTQAVRERRGIPHRDGRTGSRAVVAISTAVMAAGFIEQYPAVGFCFMVTAYVSAWPWIRSTVEEVRSWR